MENDYLKYYGERNISPVNQDISNIGVHYERRKKLYRQCGIPTIAFRNAELLEVGPGGGYNTLAFFHWGCRHVDLAEANPKGIEDMQQLFAEQKISPDKYEIFPCEIEDYQTDKKYDIIIAEGFLPHIYNQEEVIEKLQKLVRPDGIIVITCDDAPCFFIEIMKRLVGAKLTETILEYDRKVEYLADFFAGQLARLKGVSRSPKEWVQDQMLAPTITNGKELTMGQAIDYFAEEFEVLGCSPQLFTDYSWYKDIWYDTNEHYRKEFCRKRLNLLMANMPEVSVPEEQAEILVKGFTRIKQYEAEYEKTLNGNEISKITEQMNSMEKILQQNFDDVFMNVFYEIKEVLSCIQQDKEIHMEDYPHFFSAFGKTQQYISFMRK